MMMKREWGEKMEREQMATCQSKELMECKEFVSLLKKFDKNEQMGVYLMSEGMKLLADKQKSGCKNR